MDVGVGSPWESLPGLGHSDPHVPGFQAATQLMGLKVSCCEPGQPATVAHSLGQGWGLRFTLRAPTADTKGLNSPAGEKPLALVVLSTTILSLASVTVLHLF